LSPRKWKTSQNSASIRPPVASAARKDLLVIAGLEPFDVALDDAFPAAHVAILGD
jgi:hypothetical protein